MRKIINEAGKKIIAAFVRENLSGHVSEETVKSYIDMAESQMVIHGGLPSLEISMCFSLTGTTECLELDEDEVSYENCILDNREALTDIFGSQTAEHFVNAEYEKQMMASGKCWVATVTTSYDGYRFSVTAVKTSLNGKVDFYEVKCLGLEKKKAKEENA